MWMPKITSNSDPEKLYVQIKNAATTALALGSVVTWDYTTAADGISCIYPTTAMLAVMAGVSPGTLAASGYGFVQAYGHCTPLTSGSTDTVAGGKLACKNAVTNVIKEGGTVIPGDSGLLYAGVAYTTTAAAAKAGFARCL
tara:strand:+ start:1477 stop:1899 length:423 start_codon:yes stop_codon:yes gene_type:complete